VLRRLRRLFVGDGGTEIRGWRLGNLERGAETYPKSAGETRNIAVSPDGKWLAAQTHGRVMVWDRSFMDLAVQICESVGRPLSREEWAQYLGTKTYRDTCSELRKKSH
jgi:hypothetical protein